jgi:hypothetical protein
MTAVMQDMVKFARALSIRYIWIDALCIIQGDPDDWMRESERMGLVYTHAFVTICTFATSSCLDSFLNRHSPVKVAFRSSLEPNIHGTLNLRHEPLYETFKHPHHLDQASGAWESRAWTVQEEQLSV